MRLARIKHHQASADSARYPKADKPAVASSEGGLKIPRASARGASFLLGREGEWINAASF